MFGPRSLVRVITSPLVRRSMFDGAAGGSVIRFHSAASAVMLIRLFQQDTTCSVLACHGRRFLEAWVNFSVSLPAKRLVRNIWQLVAGLTGLSVRSAGTSVRMS